MEPKKNPKIEVGRNSSLYFAIGLNLMLLITYYSLEYKTYEKAEISIDNINLADNFEEDIPITNHEVLPPPPPPPAAPESIQVVDDVLDIEETFIESSETNQEAIIVKSDIVSIDEVDVEEVEEDIEVPFTVVEQVPIFPGCKGNNEELKACFQKQMNLHIKENFEYPEEAIESGINGKVYVLFSVDKYGNISRVKSRGPNKILEAEAERIICALPRMEPAKQRGKPVSVPYSVPITFKLKQ